MLDNLILLSEKKKKHKWVIETTSITKYPDNANE